MAIGTTYLEPQVLAAVVILSAIVYPIYLAIARLYFLPIAGFPGPRIAAATGWYEFYYDFWKSGKYIYEIKKMHEKYGKFTWLH
jgi:hypothetical protein